MGRPARDSRNNEAGSAAPRPRAPSPERRRRPSAAARAWTPQLAPPPRRAPQLGRGPGLRAVQRDLSSARPARRPRLPAARAPHPTFPIKVHFGRERGLRLPPPHAPPATGLPRARASASVRAARAAFGLGRPWLPGRAGCPPDRTCGSPQADIFFSAEAASAPSSARLRIPPRLKRVGLTPRCPARSRLPRRGSGTAEGAGRHGAGRSGGRTKPTAGGGRLLALAAP